MLKRFMAWTFDSKSEWRGTVVTILLAVILSFVIAFAIAIPVSLHYDKVGARCETINAKPVDIRGIPRFCELPNHTIVTIPKEAQK